MNSYIYSNIWLDSQNEDDKVNTKLSGNKDNHKIMLKHQNAYPTKQQILTFPINNEQLRFKDEISFFLQCQQKLKRFNQSLRNNSRNVKSQMSSANRKRWNRARQANVSKAKGRKNSPIKRNNDLSNILSQKTLNSKEIKSIMNTTAAK